MMTLEDVFNELEYGELADFYTVQRIDGSTGIEPGDYPHLITLINRGLTKLHTELVIREKEVSLDMYDELSFYPLDSRYAFTRQDEFPENPPIIRDHEGNPFTDDILRITSIWDTWGERPLNDFNDDRSVFLTNYKTIQVSEPITGNSLFVLYQADHPKIPTDTTDLASVEIEIPEYCVTPLLHYVAAKMFARSLNQDHQMRSANLLAQFDGAVQTLKRQNMLNTAQMDTNDKLYDRGFV